MIETVDLATRAQRIKVIGFDVDGVCTDGRIYYGPSGEALHAFSARDGLGIVLARKAGIVMCAVTGRKSPNVQARLSELRVPHILQGCADKAASFAGVLGQLGVTWEHAAFIGDDVNDVPCMKRAGLAACVPDSADGVADFAHVVTRRRGGEGALRELIDIVLRSQGRWLVDREE